MDWCSRECSSGWCTVTPFRPMCLWENDFWTDVRAAWGAAVCGCGAFRAPDCGADSACVSLCRLKVFEASDFGSHPLFSVAQGAVDLQQVSMAAWGQGSGVEGYFISACFHHTCCKPAQRASWRGLNFTREVISCQLMTSDSHPRCCHVLKSIAFYLILEEITRCLELFRYTGTFPESGTEHKSRIQSGCSEGWHHKSRWSERSRRPGL